MPVGVLSALSLHRHMTRDNATKQEETRVSLSSEALLGNSLSSLLGKCVSSRGRSPRSPLGRAPVLMLGGGGAGGGGLSRASGSADGGDGGDGWVARQLAELFPSDARLVNSSHEVDALKREVEDALAPQGGAAGALLLPLASLRACV
jgi:hypothetical protein